MPMANSQVARAVHSVSGLGALLRCRAALFTGVLVLVTSALDATAGDGRFEVIHTHASDAASDGDTRASDGDSRGGAAAEEIIRGGLPAFAALDATLANWDSGVEPDGWVARVQVFDSMGRLVPFVGTASFELVPRIPSADLTRFLAVPGKRLRWNLTLTSEGDGGASVKLPLRRSLPRTATGAVPYSGVLRVRLAVPTAGVYEAESVVAIDPPGLVDTLWKPR